MKIHIGIVDDHQLLLKSLGILIDGFASCTVVMDAVNGEELLKQLAVAPVKPDILLVDVNMPVMDGRATARAVSEKYPEIKMIALSMKDDDLSIIEMLKAGCCAYLLKDIHPAELEKALQQVYTKGFYYDGVDYPGMILKGADTETLPLSEREKEFLRLACSDRTYKEIASLMYLSERTIDGYRERLFEKLNVKSRVGMALEAIRRNLADL